MSTQTKLLMTGCGIIACSLLGWVKGKFYVNDREVSGRGATAVAVIALCVGLAFVASAIFAAP
jgi:hypothetical protein